MEDFNPKQAEQDLIDWINKARQNPALLISHLEERLATFNDKAWKRGDKWFNSREGSAPVADAISYLKSLSPMKPLRVSESLNQAALDHCKDMETSGLTGHTGSDQSSFSKRVERYGRWSGGLTEHTAYQQTAGLDFLLYWVVDDGISSRQNRLNLFKPEYGVVGAAVGFHSKQKTCAVLLLGGEIKDGEKGKEATLVEGDYMRSEHVKLGEDGKITNYLDHQKQLMQEVEGEYFKMGLIKDAVSVAEERHIVQDGDKKRVFVKKIYTMTDGSLKTFEQEDTSASS